MYQPPVDDYDFLLRHVVDGANVLELATAGEYKVDDLRQILSGAADVALASWHPLNAIGDRLGNMLVDGQVTTPPGTIEAYHALRDAGWMSVYAPKEAGGEGMPWVFGNALNEIWCAADVALSLVVGLSVAAIGAVHAAADDALRSTYLPNLVSGRWTGTMNLTEPQAGTDLGAIRTLARPNGDGTWAVKGQKIFITWGDHDLADNIIHLVLARTPDAPEGMGGLSLFLVPKYLPDPGGDHTVRNAVRTLALEHKLGIHASATCVLEYENATGFLLGGLNGGLMAMFVMMNIARVGAGVQGLGVADRAYQQARDYAAERVQGPVLGRPAQAPIAEHPDVARLLMSMASRVSAMRAVSVQVAAWLDEAPDDPQSASLAEFFVPVLKGWFTETAVQVTSDAIQVHGGAGYIEETGAAQHLRDARILPIYEGTTAIQAKDLVGRKVLRDGGETAAAAADLVTATIATLRESDHPVAERTAGRLERAVAATLRATRTLLEFGEQNRKRDAYAASVAYLQSWGLLAGGWMHARMLVAALAEPSDHSARRLAEADFYGAHHLSRIGSLAESIDAGEIVYDPSESRYLA